MTERNQKTLLVLVAIIAVSSLSDALVRFFDYQRAPDFQELMKVVQAQPLPVPVYHVHAVEIQPVGGQRSTPAPIP